MTNEEFRDFIENDENELVECYGCESSYEIANAYRKLVRRIVEKVDELDNPDIMLLEILTGIMSDLQLQKEYDEIINDVILYILKKGEYSELHILNMTLKVDKYGKLKINDRDFWEVVGKREYAEIVNEER